MNIAPFPFSLFLSFLPRLLEGDSTDVTTKVYSKAFGAAKGWINHDSSTPNDNDLRKYVELVCGGMTHKSRSIRLTAGYVHGFSNQSLC